MLDVERSHRGVHGPGLVVLRTDAAGGENRGEGGRSSGSGIRGVDGDERDRRQREGQGGVRDTEDQPHRRGGGMRDAGTVFGGEEGRVHRDTNFLKMRIVKNDNCQNRREQK